LTDTTQQNHIPILRKSDIILIISIVLLSALALLFLRFLPASSGMVTVTADGDCIGCWPLAEDIEIQISGSYGTNRLLIADGKASITDADCPDLICVHHIPISHVGERIVCLPNRVVVSIGAKENSTSLDAVSQ